LGDKIGFWSLQLSYWVKKYKLNMKRVLFLSQLVPYPPDAGAKVRSYYVLRYLAQRFEVTLLAFSRSDDRPEAIEHLRQYCKQVITVPIQRTKIRDLRMLAGSLLSGESFIIRRDTVPEMNAQIERLIASNSFDYVHADQLWMAQYGLHARQVAQGKKPCLVLDEHNACFQIYQRLAENEKDPFKRWLWAREWPALQRFEVRACASFDRVITVTEEDREILGGLMNGSQKGDLRAGPRKGFDTIPICVDADAVQPVTPKPNSLDALHLGTMFWMPNVEGVLWFARNVWPIVRQRFPQATFTVVGKNPPVSIRELEASAPQGSGSGIVVTGYVADPQPYLEKAAVFVVPLFSAGGMRVKIVDGWRWGLPIVSTTIGAEGISYLDGENILIADSPEDFSRAVIRVLSDLELAQSLRQNGRRWVEQHYDWRKVYSAWDAIYPP
jgi:glycosyltransferase involved in cell wall biosynthesis